MRERQAGTGGILLKDWHSIQEAFGVSLKDVNLSVRAGEIVAIAGIAGNGQKELFDALSGEEPLEKEGMVIFAGEAAGRMDINERRMLGAAFVPEERLGHGAVPALRLTENVVLTRHGTGEGIARRGFTRFGRAGRIVEKVVSLFDVRKGVVDPEARSLSGGNLQKFVVGREVQRTPKILIIAQPTWGVDAGAAAVIRSIADRSVAQGRRHTGHLARPRRDLRDRRPYRGHFARPPSKAEDADTLTPEKLVC
jgi:nucleoside ABC transporter ATP-binding protein